MNTSILWNYLTIIKYIMYEYTFVIHSNVIN